MVLLNSSGVWPSWSRKTAGWGDCWFEKIIKGTTIIWLKSQIPICWLTWFLWCVWREFSKRQKKQKPLTLTQTRTHTHSHTHQRLQWFLNKACSADSIVRPTKEQKSHTPFAGHSGKEHPGCLHYLFTVTVPQQTFLPLRRPRNKHTGQGGESLGRSEVVERGSAITKHQTRVPETETKQQFLCFCFWVLQVLPPHTGKLHISGTFTKCSARVEW